MKRIHLFEWEDLPWFPNILREAMTDYLRFAIVKLGFYDAAIPELEKLLSKTDEKQIIDLCSGGGGGIPTLAPAINKGREEPVHFILTDKYPNETAIAYFKQNIANTEYWKESIDATAVPDQLTGIRTLFSSFHHFRPEIAKNILADAARKNMPIAIFDESADLRVLKLLSLLIVPIMVIIFMPFIKPFRWSRIIFTYFIPILPLLILWDGAVSILRMYSENEIKELLKDIEVQDYHWEMGKKGKLKVQQIQYVLGWPRR